jgi:hypothetical protein
LPFADCLLLSSLVKCAEAVHSSLVSVFASGLRCWYLGISVGIYSSFIFLQIEPEKQKSNSAEDEIRIEVKMEDEGDSVRTRQREVSQVCISVDDGSGQSCQESRANRVFRTKINVCPRDSFSSSFTACRTSDGRDNVSHGA